MKNMRTHSHLVPVEGRSIRVPANLNWSDELQSTPATTAPIRPHSMNLRSLLLAEWISNTHSSNRHTKVPSSAWSISTIKSFGLAVVLDIYRFGHYLYVITRLSLEPLNHPTYLLVCLYDGRPVKLCTRLLNILHRLIAWPRSMIQSGLVQMMVPFPFGTFGYVTATTSIHPVVTTLTIFFIFFIFFFNRNFAWERRWKQPRLATWHWSASMYGVATCRTSSRYKFESLDRYEIFHMLHPQCHDTATPILLAHTFSVYLMFRVSSRERSHSKLQLRHCWLWTTTFGPVPFNESKYSTPKTIAWLCHWKATRTWFTISSWSVARFGAARATRRFAYGAPRYVVATIDRLVVARGVDAQIETIINL